MQEGSRGLQSKKRYLLAFLIGTLVFILGFSVTYAVSLAEFQRISNLQGETSYQIFSDKILHSFFNKDICTESSFRKISQDLRFQGVIIDDLEKKLGKNNPQVLFRKKFYTLIELEHLEFVTERNKQCNESTNTILFLYSNAEEESVKSEDAGRLLDTLYLRNSNLVIYSFDVNLESDLIEQLIKKYEVETIPFLVINEDVRLVEFENISEIEKYLSEPLKEDVIRL